MFVGTLVLLAATIKAGGGLAALMAKVAAIDPQPPHRLGISSLVCPIFLLWILYDHIWVCLKCGSGLTFKDSCHA